MMKKLLLSVLCFTLLVSATFFVSGCKKKHTHSFTEQAVKDEYLSTAADCTNKAKYFYSCSCGEKGSETFVYGSPLGHSLSEWKIQKEATETEKGLKTRNCTRSGCNYSETENIPMLSHTHKFTAEIAAEKYLATAATCTEKAQYYYSCSCGEKCSKTFEYGSPLGHSLSEWKIQKEATETEKGLKTRNCTRNGCNYSESENIPMLSHAHKFTAEIAAEKYLATAATCTEKAKYYYSCSCGEKGTQTFTYGAALGHSFTNYVSDNNATYEKDGTKTAHCNRDGCTATNTIPDEGSKLESKISFKTLTVGQKNIDGNIPVYGKVSNSQKNYSFIDEVETWGNIQYVVSLDIYGIQQVATKTIPLKEGDNVVYITEQLNGNPKAVYEVTIRRREIYTVTFNSQGGTAVENQAIEEDSLAIQPASPTKKGYTFNKWAFDFSSPITKNIQINAEWDIIHYNIYYNLNGGIISGNLPISYTVEDEITLTLYPTKEYYEFNFWSNEGKILKGSTEDKSFEAFFTPIEYNISYDCGNGINNDGNKSTYNIEDNIKLLDPYYINADFIEWQKDGESISEIPVGSHGDISLTSIWKDYDIKLSLNQDGETYTVIGLNKPNLTVLNILPYYKDKAVTIIKEYAFRDCSKLYRVKIPDTVQIIGGGAFSGCTTLRELTIPFVGKSRNVDYVYEGCLGYIFDYTSTTDPTYSQIDKYNCLSTTKEIYYKESYFYFKVPTSLVIVDILEGIESLNEYAFYNYSGLGAIRIPITVKEIRKNSIRKVSSTWVYYNGTKEEWGNINISSEVDIKKVLYYSPTKPTTEGNYWYYDSNGNIEEW